MQFKSFKVLLGGGNYGRAAGTAGHEVDRGGSGLLGEHYQHALAHSFALVDEHDHAAVLQVSTTSSMVLKSSIAQYPISRKSSKLSWGCSPSKRST